MFVGEKKYWELRMIEQIQKGEDLRINHYFSPLDQKKLLVLMTLWEVGSVESLLKLLIDSSYSLLRVKQVNAVMQKEAEEKEREVEEKRKEEERRYWHL